MKNLNFLREIVQKLNVQELSSIRLWLSKPPQNGEVIVSKSLHLLETILEMSEITAKELELRLYGKKNYLAFNKLVSRLTEKVLDALLFERNLSNDNYTLRNRIVFQSRKKIMQLDILILKGVRTGLDPLFNKVLSISKKYEVYDVLIQALNSKLRYTVLSSRKKVADKIQYEIKIAEQNLNLYLQSQSDFNSIIRIINSSSNPNMYIIPLKEGIDVLSNNYRLSGSATIGYYHYLLLAEYSQIIKDYKSAGESLMKLVDLVKRSPSVYTQNRYGTALLNLASNNIYLNKYNGGEELINESIKLFNTSQVNIPIALELKYFLSFYCGDIENAKKINNQIKNNYIKLINPLLKAKLEYYESVYEFLKYNFVQAKKNITNIVGGEFDKGGWNLVSNIFLMQVYCELKDEESLDLLIQKVEKNIKRSSRSIVIKKRYLIIIKIIKKIITSNFNFAQVKKGREKYFELLNNGGIEYTWEIMGPELIIFEEWFSAKLQGKNYNHVEVMKKYCPEAQ